MTRVPGGTAAVSFVHRQGRADPERTERESVSLGATLLPPPTATSGSTVKVAFWSLRLATIPRAISQGPFQWQRTPRIAPFGRGSERQT